MPGMNAPVSNYQITQMYSLRGTVEENGVRESGWWIFKERMPFIRVKVNEGQLTAFNSIARQSMSTFQDGDSHLHGIASVLELGMTDDERKKYPVSVEIGLTFGYSGPIGQFFCGADPLRLMKLTIIDGSTCLENEVTASM